MSGLNAYFMFISHIFLPSHPFKKYSRMAKHFKFSLINNIELLKTFVTMTVKFIREHCVILFRVRICFYQTVLARLSRNIHMKGCYKKRD